MRLAILTPVLAVILMFAGAASAMDKENTLYIDLKDGRVVIEMRPDLAPKHVAQIKKLAREGKYDGVVFHRVIDGFMIQGGGFDKDMKEKKTGAPIALENRSGLRNERGSIAMARTMDPNSATAQFFVNLSNNAFLDPANSRDGNGYAVFGKVVEGMDVVDRIKAVPTTTKGPHQNVPATPVLIKKATLEP